MVKYKILKNQLINSKFNQSKLKKPLKIYIESFNPFSVNPCRYDKSYGESLPIKFKVGVIILRLFLYLICDDLYFIVIHSFLLIQKFLYFIVEVLMELHQILEVSSQ
jgi:hypothetical protein